MRSKISVVVFLLLLLGAGLWAVGTTYSNYTTAQTNIEQSEPVEATVTDTRVETKQVHTDDGSILQYHPTVSYTYSYEGVSFASESLYPGSDPVRDQERNARNVIAEFEKGDEVTAYVNTNDPSEAYLIEEYSAWQDYVWMGMGVILLFVGATVQTAAIRAVATSNRQ